MAHTNNLKRAARTHYPAISKKKKKVSTRSNAHSDYPTTDYEAPVPAPEEPGADVEESVEVADEDRAVKAALITEYHALEKQLAASKDPLERRLIAARQLELGGLSKYQEASLHGGDKVRGGETGKWCIEALMELQVRNRVMLSVCKAESRTDHSADG